MTIDSHSHGVMADQGLGLSTYQPPIDDLWVARVIELIDKSGICARVAEWRAIDKEATREGPGGRPRGLDDHVVLVLLLVLALEGSPVLLKHLAAAIACRLSERAREMPGITPNQYDAAGWYDRCWRAFHAFVDVIDPFPGPRNRLLIKDEWAEVIAARDPEESLVGRLRN
ncbi:MAG: hypothetical protein MP439_05490 [Ferrimicrobium sp.]|jgi:hypothetical protein|nr:hypothetical protein [Ferrimicrobium sp.]